MTRRNLFAAAESRAQLQEANQPTTACRRQRTALAREVRRLGWHTTAPQKAKAR
jgi:hypothetical protein